MAAEINHFAIWTTGSSYSPGEWHFDDISHPDVGVVEDFGDGVGEWSTHLTGNSSWGTDGGEGEFFWDTNVTESDVAYRSVPATQSAGPYSFTADLVSDPGDDINVGWYSDQLPDWGDWNRTGSDGRRQAGISFNLRREITGTVRLDTNVSSIDTGVSKDEAHEYIIKDLDFSTSPQTGTYEIRDENGSLLDSGDFEFDWGGAGEPVCSGDARFCDAWTDGDYTSSPPWQVYLSQGDFSVDVRTMASVPKGGPNVLHLTETTGGGTDGVIGWADG